MQDVIVMNKQVGETPLECIMRFKESHPEYKDIKMTYAGRLDPMASGVLIILAGDMVHRKDEFLKLPKTYECVAILGIETDTYDVLGLPTLLNSIPNPSSWQEEGDRASELLKSFIGTFSQKYPPYSSKTINGKQMHTLAREGGFAGLEIPAQTVTVKNISMKGMGTIAMGDLVSDITSRIQKVSGDFRQIETIQAWQKLAQKDSEKRLIFAMFTIEVSGGTYIRSIVHEWGNRLGVGGTIWKLKRTKLGEWYI